MKNSKADEQRTFSNIPKNLIDAIDRLVDSGDEEGCEDLVQECHKLGMDYILTHID